MSLAAGKIRHRVTIQEYAYLGQDPITGDEIREWRDVHTCWAAVEPLSVREFTAAQATQSKVKARVTIRYLDGLDASMRIVHTVHGAQRVYNIEGILADPDSGFEYLTLAVSEGTSISGQ